MKHLQYTALIFTFSIFLSACQVMDQLADDFDDLRAGKVTYSSTTTDPSQRLLESPCPQVEIVDDLSSLSDFTSPHAQKKENLISRIDLASAESTCKLASKSAVIDLRLLFNGTLGAKGRNNANEKPFFSYPFFIAVTEPNGSIMAKEIFAASMTYAPGTQNHTYFENLRQIIPIKNEEQARAYKILIGFQVTPDQLAYNRAHMIPVTSK